MTAILVALTVRRFLRGKPQSMVLSFMTLANLLVLAGSRRGDQVVATEHNILSCTKPPGSASNASIRVLVKRLYPRAVAVACVSHDVADDLGSITGEGRVNRVVVYNPIDAGRIRALSEARDEPLAWRSTNPQSVMILLVGAFKPAKGHARALRALALLPDKFHLVLVGDGGLHSCLENLTEELGLKNRVHFVGATPNPYAWMRLADVLVVPSLYEGFGLVVAEGALLGTPVVTSGGRGLREVAVLTNSVVVDGGDAALATALMTNATGRREALSERTFDPDIIAEAYTRLLERPRGK